MSEMNWPTAVTIITSLGGVIAIIWKIVGSRSRHSPEELDENKRSESDSGKNFFRENSRFMKKIIILEVNQSNIEKNLTEVKNEVRSMEMKIENKIEGLRELILNISR